MNQSKQIYNKMSTTGTLQNNNKLSKGAVAAIVVGTIAIIIGLILLFGGIFGKWFNKQSGGSSPGAKPPPGAKPGSPPAKPAPGSSPPPAKPGSSPPPAKPGSSPPPAKPTGRCTFTGTCDCPQSIPGTKDTPCSLYGNQEGCDNGAAQFSATGSADETGCKKFKDLMKTKYKCNEFCNWVPTPASSSADTSQLHNNVMPTDQRSVHDIENIMKASR